ncbi:MAG TPA: tetratricopeptide repeat protein [Schlesneria sp.]
MVPSPVTEVSPAKNLAKIHRKRLHQKMVLLISGLLIVGAAYWALPRFLKWQVRRDLTLRNLDKASSTLDQFDRWYGVDGESSFLRARLCRKRGDWNGVHEALVQAQKLQYPVALLEREQWLTQAQSGQLRPAEPHLPQLLVDPQNDGGEICEAFVNGYFLNHRLTDALRLLDAWIGDYPKDPEPRIIRGKIRVDQQYLKEAEADLRVARSLAPKSSAAALELADVLILERQVEEALQIYQKFTGTNHDSLRARLGEARAERLLNHAETARSIAERILNDDPENREALLELALADLELNGATQAVTTLKRALELNPRSIVVRQGLAKALRAAGRSDQAREHAKYIEKAQMALAYADQLATRVASHPDDVEARYEIGMTYLQYAVPERGIQWLKSVRNYDPNHKRTNQALADYYAKQSATSSVDESQSVSSPVKTDADRSDPKDSR